MLPQTVAMIIWETNYRHQIEPFLSRVLLVFPWWWLPSSKVLGVAEKLWSWWRTVWLKTLSINRTHPIIKVLIIRGHTWWGWPFQDLLWCWNECWKVLIYYKGYNNTALKVDFPLLLPLPILQIFIDAHCYNAGFL